MEVLPPIRGAFVERPGNGRRATQLQNIPDPERSDVWIPIYEKLKEVLSHPIKRGNKEVDPYFGYFGYRWHPVIHSPGYFHVGIDIPNKMGTKVYPVAKGIFEYSGFTSINGKYILMTHPEIKTEDGFVLSSLYLHLKDAKIKFTTYQKMLREISKHTYPKIEVQSKKIIGEVGNSGDLRGMISHLHLQLEFRNQEGTIIVINSARALGLTHGENLSRVVANEDDFIKFCREHRAMLLSWREYWGERYLPEKPN